MMPRLITITFSHYCEKARWALDRARIPYVEDGHLPMFAWVPALRAGRRRTVPSLVTDDGAIPDSTDILRWCDARGDAPPLFTDEPQAEPAPGDPASAASGGAGSEAAEVADLEARFDRELGPHTRRLAYHHLLPTIGGRLGGLRGVPRGEVLAARVLAPAMSVMMRRGLKIDAAGVARSEGKLAAVLADVEQRLADGRRYLVGDRLTAADLTFAALMTPLVAPPELSGYLPFGDLPPGFAAIVDATRARPAGAFALRLYRDERGLPGGGAAA